MSANGLRFSDELTAKKDELERELEARLRPDENVRQEELNELRQKGPEVGARKECGTEQSGGI